MVRQGIIIRLYFQGFGLSKHIKAFVLIWDPTYICSALFIVEGCKNQTHYINLLILILDQPPHPIMLNISHVKPVYVILAAGGGGVGKYQCDVILAINGQLGQSLQRASAPYSLGLVGWVLRTRSKSEHGVRIFAPTQRTHCLVFLQSSLSAAEPWFADNGYLPECVTAFIYCSCKEIWLGAFVSMLPCRLASAEYCYLKPDLHVLLTHS